MLRGILFMAHSGVRYLVLLAAVAALVYLLGSLRKPSDRRASTVMAVFTGLLDLQVLLGLLNLTQVPFYAALSGHIVMMFGAAVVAHGFAISHRNRAPERQSNGFLLIGVVVTLVLLLGGILAIGRPIIGSGVQ